ncbi:MAG: signal peptidase I, partial [Oscillospiraceae bacterium]|nr:signal peptidase I [Oscillospiraceae bacterium]
VPIIKRVIATEGQTIDFDFQNWQVTVDGKPLVEPYVNYEPGTMMANENIDLSQLPITVEPGKIFVMGDNRNHSTDSRSIGQVDIRDVVGRVLIRIFPLNEFGVVKPHVS